MKRYIFLLFLIITSCTKDLDQISPNSISKTNYWKTDADFLSGLAATYKVFKDVNNGYWAVRGVELTNGRGDETFIRNDVKDLYQLSTFTNNATTGVPASIFTGAYNGILRANQVIENAPLSQISDASKTQFIAEGKFLRAVNYYILAINFGAVPIITSVPKLPTDSYVKESAENLVWAQIIADFKDAASGLPVNYSSDYVGRATKGAALGFLAKAYVYSKDWTNAEATFKLISQANGMPMAPYNYDLLANYEDNFLASKDNNIESLFEIQIQNVGGTKPWDGENSQESQGVTTAQEFAPSEVSGWFELFPNDKIFDEFQKELTIDQDFDPRMYATLVWDNTITAPPVPKDTNKLLYYTLPYDATHFTNPFGFKSMVRKYQNWRNVNEGNWISEINEKVLRYSDILLLYAETLTMQQRVNEAYPLVNRIRKRANLSDLAPGLSVDDMMKEIRHQRMIEFYREGQRFYDLKRWGLLEQEIANSNKEGKQFFQEKFTYFPIPQNEINTNVNIEQNPAWR